MVNSLKNWAKMNGFSAQQKILKKPIAHREGLAYIPGSVVPRKDTDSITCRTDN